MAAPDLTNLTADELRRIAIGDGTTADDPYAAVDELHRRAQANDALRSAAQWVATAERDMQASMEANDGFVNAKLEQLQERCGDLRTALAAAPAAQPTPAATATDVNCDLRPGERDEPDEGVCDGERQARDFMAMELTDEAKRKARGWWIPELLSTIDCLRAERLAFLRRAELAESKLAQDTPTPAAPVTDAEIEAAITALTVDARREADALRVNPEASGTATEKRANRQVQLRALIARRVASAGAAPVDSEREAAIDQAIRHHWNCARSHARGDTSPQCVEDCLKADERLRALMRSAPPQGRGDDGMRLVGLDLFSLRDSLAADRPAPVDSEREAAIEAWRGVAMQDSMDEADDYDGFTPTKEDVGTPDELFALRREEIDEAVRLMRSAPPAPAGDQDAKLRELRARLLSTAASLPNRQMGHSDEDFDRGYVEACENWAQEIDRLLAAPAASAIAAAPEAPKREPWEERWNDAETGSREELLAMRDGLSSHARRIEALERANNKEAGK